MTALCWQRSNFRSRPRRSQGRRLRRQAMPFAHRRCPRPRCSTRDRRGKSKGSTDRRRSLGWYVRCSNFQPAGFRMRRRSRRTRFVLPARRWRPTRFRSRNHRVHRSPRSKAHRNTKASCELCSSRRLLRRRSRFRRLRRFRGQPLRTSHPIAWCSRTCPQRIRSRNTLRRHSARSHGPRSRHRSAGFRTRRCRYRSTRWQVPRRWCPTQHRNSNCRPHKSERSTQDRRMRALAWAHSSLPRLDCRTQHHTRRTRVVRRTRTLRPTAHRNRMDRPCTDPCSNLDCCNRVLDAAHSSRLARPRRTDRRTRHRIAARWPRRTDPTDHRSKTHLARR